MSLKHSRRNKDKNGNKKKKNRQKLMGIFSFLEKGLSLEVLLLR